LLDTRATNKTHKCKQTKQRQKTICHLRRIFAKSGIFERFRNALARPISDATFLIY